MFGFGKKKEKAPVEVRNEFLATQNGKVVKVDDLPDPVFSGKVLGDGFAVLPTENEVHSPVSGRIIDIQDTLHAYGIETDDGLQVLVHIGINTVSLNGDGFKSKVKLHQRVNAGDVLAVADLDLIKQRGFETYTVTLITNIDEVKSIDVKHVGEDVEGAKTVVLTYNK